MNKIATTIEQSKKLIELGLNADTADMYYYNNDEIPQIISDIKLLKENINPKFYTLAWSLSALMELMDDDTSFTKEYTNWIVCDNINTYMSDSHLNHIDAAFEVICYLLKNKLI